MYREQLEYFALAYRLGSFSAAAKRVPMSPQGLAKSVRSLEGELGVTLFEAGANGEIAPTEYADELLRFVNRFEAGLSSAKEAFRRIRAAENREVRVDVALGILGYLGPDFVKGFERRHPGVALRYDEVDDVRCAEERRKDKEAKSAEANLIREQKQIEIQKAKLDAEQKQAADVQLYQRQKEAEAKLFEEQKSAEAIKIRAEQEAAAVRIKAEADADAKRQVGLAEAEALRAKGLAEAEAIDKKAEAMKKYGEAAMLEMYFNVLPEISKNITAPLGNIDKITMYGDGNNAKLVGDITKSLTQITDGLNDSLGVDVKSLVTDFLKNKTIGAEKTDR